VQDTIQITNSKSDSVSISMEQEIKINKVDINGGSSSTINIKQGS